MAKVFGIHQLELKPDANVAEFEQFVRDELNAVPGIPGWQGSIAKGDRGESVGKYVLIVEVESLETRNRDIPHDGPVSPAMEKWRDTSLPTFDKLNSYLTAPFGMGVFTDYVVVSR